MIKNLTRREKKIFLFTVIAVGAAVFYRAVFVPLEARNRSLSEDILRERQEMNRDRRVAARGNMIDARMDGYVNQFSVTGTEEEAVSSILTDLEGAVRAYRLKVSDLKPQKVKTVGDNHEFSVSLTINGELLDVVRLLYALQQKPHLFDVREMQLEQASRGKDPALKTRLVLTKVFILTGARAAQEEAAKPL